MYPLSRLRERATQYPLSHLRERARVRGVLRLRLVREVLQRTTPIALTPTLSRKRERGKSEW